MTLGELILGGLLSIFFFENGKDCSNGVLKTINFSLSGLMIFLIVNYFMSEA